MNGPCYDRHGVTVHAGDCLDVLRDLPDSSVSAIVTDPPYGLSDLKPAQVTAAIVAWASGDRERVPDSKGFMGRDWDAFVPPPAVWDECLRVLKPGGHLAAFAGSRTAGLMDLSIRMAGFEIRDGLVWLYGNGMPKGMDVSKAIDKARDDRADVDRVTAWLAKQRDRAGWTNRQIDEVFGFSGMAGHWTAGPHLKIAQVPRLDQWEKLRELLGFGSEMDDEVWRLNGRKGTWGNGRSDRVIGLPGSNRVLQSTQQVIQAGTPVTPEAARWDGWNTSLKPAHEPIILARKPIAEKTIAANVVTFGTGGLNVAACRTAHTDASDLAASQSKNPGRADVVTSEAYGTDRPQQSVSAEGRWPTNVLLDGHAAAELDGQAEDTVSRFFPVFRWEAKAPTAERPKINGKAHPTVKPIALMRWLVRLLTPPGGLVVDPFAGTGTTLQAARAEGMRSIGIELDPDHIPLIVSRLDGYRDASTTPIDPATGKPEPMDLLDLLTEDGAA